MIESEYENINIEANKYQKIEWLSEKELKNSPISTAMKKVLKLDNAANSEVILIIIGNGILMNRVIISLKNTQSLIIYT